MQNTKQQIIWFIIHCERFKHIMWSRDGCCLAFCYIAVRRSSNNISIFFLTGRQKFFRAMHSSNVQSHSAIWSCHTGVPNRRQWWGLPLGELNQCFHSEIRQCLCWQKTVNQLKNMRLLSTAWKLDGYSILLPPPPHIKWYHLLFFRKYFREKK